MSAKASGKELMTQPLLFGDRENICPECGGGLHLCGKSVFAFMLSMN